MEGSGAELVRRFRLTFRPPPRPPSPPHHSPTPSVIPKAPSVIPNAVRNPKRDSSCQPTSVDSSHRYAPFGMTNQPCPPLRHPTPASSSHANAIPKAPSVIPNPPSVIPNAVRNPKRDSSCQPTSVDSSHRYAPFGMTGQASNTRLSCESRNPSPPSPCHPRTPVCHSERSEESKTRR